MSNEKKTAKNTDFKNNNTSPKVEPSFSVPFSECVTKIIVNKNTDNKLLLEFQEKYKLECEVLFNKRNK